jgi:hypothetical protein
MNLSPCGLKFCCSLYGKDVGCRDRPIIFDQNRISIAEHPNNVAMLKRNIHVIAAGCTPNAASCPTPPKIIPSPPVIVNPITIVGIVSLTGGANTGAGSIPVVNERFAPHLLQYFSSTVISVAQLGQYIKVLPYISFGGFYVSLM